MSHRQSDRGSIDGICLWVRMSDGGFGEDHLGTGEKGIESIASVASKDDTPQKGNEGGTP